MSQATENSVQRRHTSTPGSEDTHWWTQLLITSCASSWKLETYILPFSEAITLHFTQQHRGLGVKQTSSEQTTFTFLNLLHACVLSRFSRFRLCATLWTAARQAPLSMGFSRQESWSRLPFPPPGDLPNPSLLHLLHWQEAAWPLVPAGKPLITFLPPKKD